MREQRSEGSTDAGLRGRIAASTRVHRAGLTELPAQEYAVMCAERDEVGTWGQRGDVGDGNGEWAGERTGMYQRERVKTRERAYQRERERAVRMRPIAC